MCGMKGGLGEGMVPLEGLWRGGTVSLHFMPAERQASIYNLCRCAPLPSWSQDPTALRVRQMLPLFLSHSWVPLQAPFDLMGF